MVVPRQRKSETHKVHSSLVFAVNPLEHHFLFYSLPEGESLLILISILPQALFNIFN